MKPWATFTPSYPPYARQPSGRELRVGHRLVGADNFGLYEIVDGIRYDWEPHNEEAVELLRVAAAPTEPPGQPVAVCLHNRTAMVSDDGTVTCDECGSAFGVVAAPTPPDDRAARVERARLEARDAAYAAINGIGERASLVARVSDAIDALAELARGGLSLGDPPHNHEAVAPPRPR